MDFVVASSCSVLNPRSCSCFFEACHGFTWSTIPWAQVLKDPWSVRYTVTRLTLVSTLFEADYIHSYLVPAFLETEELLPVEKNHMRKELEKVLISKSAVSAMMAIVDDRRSFDLP